MNVLFICSRNQWRSPTAEHHWRNHPQWSVRSAGTSRNAKRRVTPALLQWADVIFVMEQKHKKQPESGIYPPVGSQTPSCP